MTHAGSTNLKNDILRATTFDLAIAEIGREHAELVDRLERLRKMLTCRPERERCGECKSGNIADCRDASTEFMTDLLDYMQNHFRVEEAAMRRLDATVAEQEAAAAHVEAHADMMERAVNLIRLAELQEERVAARDLIGDWLREHIATHDTLLLDRLRRAAKPTT